MASRALAQAARSSDDYRRVYGSVLRQVSQPVILHWLGDMFDPQLAGYWGTADLDEAMDVCLDIIAAHAQRWTASRSRCSTPSARSTCASAARRRAHVHRRRLQLRGAHRGDGARHSDALLGIFDAIAPPLGGAPGAGSR